MTRYSVSPASHNISIPIMVRTMPDEYCTVLGYHADEISELHAYSSVI